MDDAEKTARSIFVGNLVRYRKLYVSRLRAIPLKCASSLSLSLYIYILFLMHMCVCFTFFLMFFAWLVGGRLGCWALELCRFQPGDATRKDLKKYFTDCGSIESVRLRSKMLEENCVVNRKIAVMAKKVETE